MSDAAESLQPRDSPTTLDDLIASYLELTDGGHEVDPASFVAPWPQHRTEFLQFVARHAGLNRLATQPPFDKAHPLHRQTAKQLEGLESEFQLGGLLGKGGMGTVWAAIRRSDQQPVAIKVLNANMSIVDDNRIRFLREARAIQSLDHPHIVPCLDVGHSGGSPYLVMKLIEGVTLSDVVAEQVRADSNQPTVPLGDSASVAPVHEADGRVAECVTQAQGNDTWFQTIGRLVADITAGLSAAHEISIVHRDVKPSNLMLDRSGKIWLTDFGLASIGESRTLLTATGDILGTPAFMSPEQAAGNRGAVDHRTDIYSLGATLYTLAARRRPYSGTGHQIIRDVCEGHLTPPSAYRTDIPRDLEAIILKAMAHQSSNRYSTCKSLERDLRHFVDGLPVQARMPGPLVRITQWMARNPATSLVTMTIVMVSVMAILIGQAVVSRRLSGLNAQLTSSNSELDQANVWLVESNNRLNSSKRDIQHLLYVSDTAAAYQAFHDNETDTARRLLTRHIPDDGESDPRGFEWHLLNRISQPAEQLSIQGHDGSATEIAMIPGTNHFLTGGTDGHVRHWSWQLSDDGLTSPTLIKEIPVAGPVHALTVSPLGDRFVVGQIGPLEVNLATLHELSSGEKTRTLCLRTTTIESACFSNDGLRIALGNRYGQITVLSIDGKLLNTLPADARNVNIGFTSDDQHVTAINNSANGINVFSLSGDEARVNLSTKFLPVAYAHASERKDWMVVAGASDVVLLDGVSDRYLTHSPDIRGRVRVVGVSDQGTSFAAGCDNGLLHVWTDPKISPSANLARTSVTAPVTIDTGSAGITSIAFVPMGSLSVNDGKITAETILATTADGQIKICRLRVADAFIRHPNKFQNVAVVTSGSRAAFAWHRKEGLCRFDELFSTDAAPTPIGVHQAADSQALAVAPDGSQVALATTDGVVVVDAVTGEVISTLENPAAREEAEDIVYSRDGRRLFVLYRTTIAEYAAADGVMKDATASPTALMNRMILHPILDKLLITTENSVSRYDPKSGEFESLYNPKYGTNRPSVSALSADGGMVAVGLEDGTIELIDVETQQKKSSLRGHRYRVHCLHFWTDNRTLVSSSADESLRFWDVKTGQSLGELPNAGRWCVPILDHNAILSCGMSGPLKLWRGEPLERP